MQRVAALFLPQWPIERLWRAEPRAGARPEPAPAAAAGASLRKPAAHEGHWRPGAKWALEDQFLPRLAGGGGPPKAVEGSPRSGGTTLRFAPGPSTIGCADGPPPRDKLGEELPRLTALRAGNRVLIVAACPRAQALGLVPGIAVTQARAQVRGLDIRPADPEGDLAALRRLAVLAARRWSPTVALSGEDGLFLDLAGTAHLFGGEEAMARRIVRLLARAGFTARLAVADTAGAAWALARHRPEPVTICPPGAQTQALAPLPTGALRIDEAAIELLRRLGIDRIGQLAALPRAPLVRRFGAATVLRLDQALGLAREPLDPVIPPQAIAVQRRFAEPILTAEAIAHWLGALVPELAAALAAEGLGAQRIALVADRVDGVPQHVRIGLARPSRDPAHLERLLLRRIEAVEPGYGIDALALHVRRAAPLGPQPAVERLDEEAAPDLAPLIDTLATRIGMRRMWRMRPVESDVPERSAARAPVLDPPQRPAPRGRRDDVRQLDRNPPMPPWHPGWPRPARLLARPEPLDHVLAELPDQPPRRFTWRGQAHRVVRADGPERIHGEWWKRDAERASVRDYFRVEDEAGRRYWLFRRGDGERGVTGDLSWYLHGVFG